MARRISNSSFVMLKVQSSCTSRFLSSRISNSVENLSHISRFVQVLLYCFFAALLLLGIVKGVPSKIFYSNNPERFSLENFGELSNLWPLEKMADITNISCASLTYKLYLFLYFYSLDSKAHSCGLSQSSGHPIEVLQDFFKRHF